MSTFYPIIESEGGPLISESDVTVYDVMQAAENGFSHYDICRQYDLLPLQLESALDYIQAYRQKLESETFNNLNKPEQHNGHMNPLRYTIIESKIGPLISDSRATVYDVMEAYDDGLSLYDICRTYNLKPLQVEVALEYISKHRERLEPKLAQIQEKKAERERYYRAQAAEIRKKIAQKPMTPQRAAFYAFLEQNRHQRRLTEEASKTAYHAWLEQNHHRAAERVAGRSTHAAHS